MKDKADLPARLTSADPGWQEWKDLVALVSSLDFEYEQDEYTGDYFTSGARLTFAVPKDIEWPQWLPQYVAALYGMKADQYEMAGGYAADFDGMPTEEGSVFGCGGVDEEMGFPRIPVPEGTYSFQSNSSGALFHVNDQLQVLYPDADAGCLKVLDTLEDFTKKCIRQALKDEQWFKAYKGLDATLLD